MALGGGKFLVQNKILPGAYINFTSASRASATLSDRGVGTLPIVLSWGPEGEVFTVSSDEFQKESMRMFGYAYTAPELKNLREFFGNNIRKGYFYKVNTGGTVASCDICKARYPGVRGNVIEIVISSNEDASAENSVYDATTFFDNILVDEQKGVTEITELVDNDFVIWTKSATLELTAGTFLTGGADGTVHDANYQLYLDEIEAYSFNTIGLASDDQILKGLFANFTRRMRDDVGAKFQCVLYRYPGDYEGVISVENKLAGNPDESSGADLVYWVTGAEAACEVNNTIGNRVYDGEYEIDVKHTQSQLEQAIKTGKFIFHKVDDSIRVLEDINTFISVTDTKNSDFSNNQTMRVLDQIGNDIAVLFNSKYLNKTPNDAAGRTSLWNDIVSHHKQLESIRAIENFEPDRLVVEKGSTKKSVVVTDYVVPTNAMSHLYMAVIVE